MQKTRTFYFTYCIVFLVWCSGNRPIWRETRQLQENEYTRVIFHVYFSQYSTLYIFLSKGLKEEYCIYTGCIWNTWTFFSNELPTPNHVRNLIPIYFHKFFDVVAPTFAQPQSFRFLSVETLTTPSVSSSNWTWRDTAPTHFDACQTIGNRAGTYERGDSLCSDVSTAA